MILQNKSRLTSVARQTLASPSVPVTLTHECTGSAAQILHLTVCAGTSRAQLTYLSLHLGCGKVSWVAIVAAEGHVAAAARIEVILNYLDVMLSKSCGITFNAESLPF
jgi:hypothetical protein